MSRFALFSLSLLVILTAPSPAEKKEAAKSLEQTLAETYAGWRKSMIDGDFAAWQKHTARYRQVVTRNNIVSQKLRFPDALFKVPMKPAPISNLKLLQARAVGPTSQLVYYGQVDVGVAVPQGTTLPQSLLILKFIKEGTQWKFNTLSLLNLSGAKEIEDQIASEDYAFLNKGNFVPPGYFPLVPRECPVPAHVGQIQITSFGYETEITINGISKHKITDTATSELIIGGLKSSPNNVVVTTRPITPPASDDPDDKEIPRKLEISVFAIPEKEGARAHKAWHYKPRTVIPNYRGMFLARP